LYFAVSNTRYTQTLTMIKNIVQVVSGRIFLPLLFFQMLVSAELQGQIVYANDTDGNIWEINLDGCASTLITNMPAFNDMAVAADGTVYGLFGNAIHVYDPVTGNITLLATLQGIYTALEIGPGGFIYAVGFDVVSVNPANGATNNLGSLPNGWFAQGDVTFLNGIYYLIVGSGGIFELIDLDLNNPSQSVVVDNPPIGGIGLAGVNNPTCPKIYMFQNGPPSAIYSYDVNTGQTEFVCTVPYSVGGADTPNGYTFNGLICPGCATEAGTFNTPNYELCEGDDLVLDYNNDAVLDQNDTEGFIVLTDTNPPLQPVFYATSPNINFNLGNFNLNTVYYVANVAGNELPNGQVSFADTCFDRSEFLTVLWRPKPEVSFTAPSALCSSDCTTIDVSFTGTAPFELEWNVTQGLGNIIEFGFANAGVNTTQIEVCLPGYDPLNGPVSLNAVVLSDANCTCD
jgi:hypothetical protein